MGLTDKMAASPLSGLHTFSFSWAACLGIPHANLELRLSGGGIGGGGGDSRLCAFELEGHAYQLGAFAFNVPKDGARRAKPSISPLGQEGLGRSGGREGAENPLKIINFHHA